jgi:hypothetical protein
VVHSGKPSTQTIQISTAPLAKTQHELAEDDIVLVKPLKELHKIFTGVDRL